MSSEYSPEHDREITSIMIDVPKTPLFSLPEVKEQAREENALESRKVKHRTSMVKNRAVQSSQKSLTKTNSAPGDLPNLLNGLTPFASKQRGKEDAGDVHLTPLDKVLARDHSTKSIRMT